MSRQARGRSNRRRRWPTWARCLPLLVLLVPTGCATRLAVTLMNGGQAPLEMRQVEHLSAIQLPDGSLRLTLTYESLGTHHATVLPIEYQLESDGARSGIVPGVMPRMQVDLLHLLPLA